MDLRSMPPPCVNLPMTQRDPTAHRPIDRVTGEVHRRKSSAMLAATRAAEALTDSRARCA